MKIVNNEKGMALVIALIIMFIMSLLGTMLYTTSSSETKAARNYRTKQDAFYAAERAIEYAKTDSNIYATIGSGSVNIPLSGVSLSAGSSNASGTVEYLANGNPPRGSGLDATEFEANFYVISAAGTGPANSMTEMETNVARIVPKK
ncbi:MAG: pilus assembly PilX N-terminal domain-containing protein [Deltaproteobacteria bacterium]|nr:pilus assembly PilX N-terminal domain-containing protein [Deltaproteobacteria bacterium]